MREGEKGRERGRERGKEEGGRVGHVLRTGSDRPTSSNKILLDSTLQRIFTFASANGN